MSSTLLYRLSGISLFWGGGLVAFGYIFHPAENPASLSIPVMIVVHLMIFFGIFLLLLGWIGMYARQSARTGVWGLIGVLLLFFGLLMNEMPHTVMFFGVAPVLASHMSLQQTGNLINAIFDGLLGPMSGIAIPFAVLGVITTAVVTLRARVLSRGIPIALFCIIGFEILTFIPVVSDIMTALKFPAAIYLCFTAVGVLILLDKAAAAQTEITEARKDLAVPSSSAGA